MSSHSRDPWWWDAACKRQAPMFDAPTISLSPVARSNVKAAAEAERIHRAKLVCGRCPVRDECLADAEIGRDEGVRAGRLLPAANWKLRKQAAA